MHIKLCVINTIHIYIYIWGALLLTFLFFIYFMEMVLEITQVYLSACIAQ